MNTFREEGLKGSLPGGILLLILYGQYGFTQNKTARIAVSGGLKLRAIRTPTENHYF